MIRGFVAIVLLAAGVAFAQAPAAPIDPGAAAASAPGQPIAFSHKVHAGTVKLPCETCHEPSKSGQSLTIPQGKLCMQCHQTIAADKPEIQRLAALTTAGDPIPWVRVYATPSFVRFSHKMHMDHNNTCKECHGDVTVRDQLFKETDISMGGCLGCHNVKKAATGCDTCHTLEANFNAPNWIGLPMRPSYSSQTVSRNSAKIPVWRIAPLM